MLHSHESFRFADRGTGKEFYAEVNWAGDDNCEKVRFTFPDGSKVVVKRNELNAMLFAMGSRDEQMKMVPSVETRSRWYETVLGITATKDIKKGEKIVMPVKITLPTFEEEIIAEAKKDVLKKSAPGSILTM